MCWMRALPADLFCENPNTAIWRGRAPRKRPLGPRGQSWCHICAAVAGWSRLATVQALGGFWMALPLPDTIQRLLPASSQAYTSGGMNCVSFFVYSIAWRVASESMVMLPFASIGQEP